MAVDKDQQLEFQFVVDDKPMEKALDNVEKESKKTADGMNKNFSQKDIFGRNRAIDFKNILGDIGGQAQELITRYSRFGTVIAGLAATGYALKQSLDLAIEGEKINKIGTAFETLASRAGLNAEDLKNSLENASGGVVDLEDVLKSSSVALTEFGSGAQKLPQLLDLARKASVDLGVDTKEAFDSILTSIASGSTKGLKGLQIFVDAGDAQTKFALALGKTKEELSEVGQRQALLNAVLEQGNKRFAAVDLTNGTLQQSLSRLDVSFGELKDTLSLIANAAFGDAFKAIANGIADINFAIAELGPQGATVSQKIRGIDQDLAGLQQRLTNLAASNAENNKTIEESAAFYDKQAAGQAGFFESLANAFSSTGVDPNFIKSQTDTVIAQMERLRAEREKLAKGLSPEDQEGLTNDSKASEKLEKEKKFQKDLLAIRSETRKLSLDNLLASATIEQAEQAQIQDAEIQSEINKKGIKEKFAADQALIDQQQKQFELDRARFQTEEALNIEADLTARRAEIVFQRNLLIEAEQQRSEQQIQNIKRDSAQKQLVEEKKNGERLQAAANAAANGVVKVTENGIAALGASLVEGASAFEAFKKNALSIVGDFLIQLGSAIIFTGAAIEALRNSIIGLFGGQAIAAGIALIALGGVLKSLGGSSGGQSAGGGTAAAPTPETSPTQDFTPPEDQEPETPKVQLAVNVNGNVLGTTDKSLALAITEILDDNFASQGLVLKRS